MTRRQDRKPKTCSLDWYALKMGKVFFNISNVQIFVSVDLSILLLSEFSLDPFWQRVLTVAK